MLKLKLVSVTFIALLLGLPLLPTQAQGTSAQDAQKEKAEQTKNENLETDIRQIGLSAGYATQCHDIKDNPEGVERVGDEALAIAQIILQDFGSNLAFLFASNAGYGAGKPLQDSSKCDELISDWEDFLERFEKEKGEKS